MIRFGVASLLALLFVCLVLVATARASFTNGVLVYPQWTANNTNGGGNCTGGYSSIWSCNSGEAIATNITIPQGSDPYVGITVDIVHLDAGQTLTVFEQGPLGTVSQNYSSPGSFTFHDGPFANSVAADYALITVLCTTSSGNGGACYFQPLIATSNDPQPTATATPPLTNTNTPTATLIPGTPPPTNTPRSVTGGTYTPTGTPVGPTSTATPTSTVPPINYYNCGDVTFPLLNCDNQTGYNASFIFGDGHPIPGVAYWLTLGSSPSGLGAAEPISSSFCGGNAHCTLIQGGERQTVVAGATGNVYALVGIYLIGRPSTSDSTWFCASSCFNASFAPQLVTMNLGAVTAGSSYNFSVCGSQNNGGPSSVDCEGASNPEYVIYNVWVGGAVTPTPANTGTPTPTGTPRPATSTNTPTPTGTRPPYLPTLTPTFPITPTPYRTATPCPGGCAVAQVSPLPGIVGTAIIIPTGPFTWLTGLSLGRTACTSFGQVPILVPHITPVASLTPLQYGWGPLTPIPMATINVNSGPISGTSIIPCADPNIPTEVWDLTYYGGVVALFIVFIGWLIWFVHRLVNNQGTAD